MKREIVFSKSGGALTVPVGTLVDTVVMWASTISGGEWSLKLEKAKKQRGVSQNALLWVWMDAIAKEWADATDQHYTKEQFKEFFAREFLPVTGPDGSVIGGSTSALTTEQMNTFLTKIQVYAAERWGITLLGSEDKMFNEWRNQYEE